MSSRPLFPRMLLWLALSVVLFVGAMLVKEMWPGSLAAVTLYKCHMASTAGWMAYWLDRSLSPYARPHSFQSSTSLIGVDEPPAKFDMAWQEGMDYVGMEGQILPSGWEMHFALIRRAIIFLGVCLCIGLGA